MGRNLWMAVFLFAASSALAQEQVIVGFYGPPSEATVEKHGGTVRSKNFPLRFVAASMPANRVSGLRKEPNVAYVETDNVRTTQLDPNDPLYATDQVDDYDLIRCPGAWSVSTGAGVRVAVLDTGCFSGHPDIGVGSSGKVKVWKNFTTSGKSTDVSDKHGHGTHTAGTVGAKTNNGTGVASAGFDCELAIGKVLSNSGTGYDSWIANGMAWAVDTAGAKVISMSLGGPGGSQTLSDAVNYAWGKGAVLVAAAGNEASSSPSYPAAYPNCISVAATDNTGTLASFSNFGSTVDIAAPGVNIVSTTNDGGYGPMSGTSMATPHVAGVAALIWATPWGTTNQSVRDRIEGTATRTVATPDGSPLRLVDAAAAVGAAANSPPAVSITSPADNATFASGEIISFSGSAADAEDGNLTASIVWTSSIDGAIGTGGSFSRALSDGKHTITASVTDSGGSTRSASVSITVGTVITPTLSVSVTTDKASYVNGEIVRITCTVTDGAAPVAGAAVTLVISAPKSTLSGSGTTDSAGVVRFNYKVNSKRDGVGTYTATATATKAGYNDGTGSTTFQVTR